MKSLKLSLVSFCLVSLTVVGCRSGDTGNTVTTPQPTTSFIVSLIKAGSGTGTVTSSPAGISCNSGCTATSASPATATYTTGTVVTLTATPTAGHLFTGWGGACASASGTSCQLTANTGTLNVVANFSLQGPVGDVIGLTVQDRIISFNTTTPETVRTNSLLTGMESGESMLGIDYRPGTNGATLYGLGSKGNLYQIAPSSGVVSGRVALTGVTFDPTASYGIDFNPVADKLRIVSSKGDNWRVDPATGAVTVETALNGAATKANAAAYTNNYAGAKGTVLLVLNSDTDKLYLQNTPASGKLSEIGSLGADVSDVNGFDISGTNLDAYAVFTLANGATRLFTLDVTTGAATQIGSLDPAVGPLRGISLLPVAPPSAASGEMLALTTNNQLINFSRTTPQTTVSLGKVLGMLAGESMVGMDYRPKNGLLYGVGSLGNLYTINTDSALASLVAALTGTGFSGLSGGSFDLGFRGGALSNNGADTGADHLRLVSNGAQNLRINPDDGKVIVDSNTNIGGGTPSQSNPSGAQSVGVTAVAYDNEFDGTNPATGAAGGSGQSRMYGVTPSNNSLVSFAYGAGAGPTGAPPYRATTIGALGFTAQSIGGLEIDGINNAAYVAATVTVENALTTNLYQVNLGTGAAQQINKIGSGNLAVRALTMKAPTKPMVFAVDGLTNNLIKFAWDAPGTLLLNVPLAGTLSNALGNGETIRALSLRQADGKLFGVSSSSNVFEIDPATGVLSNKKPMTPSINDPNSPFVALGNEGFGIDFNPTIANGASLRLLSAAALNNNLRIDAGGGAAPGETFTDADLTDATTMNDVTADAAAYDFGFKGATTSTLYAIGIASNFLYTVGDPDASDGLMTQVDPTTPMFGPTGAGITPTLVAMDVVGGNNGLSLLATYSAADGSQLWRLDLGSGAISAVPATNTIGGTGPAAVMVRGLTIQMLPQ